MDAVEFLKERVRMCHWVEKCSNCPINSGCLETEPESLVKTVKQWAKEHPKKTMLQDFFEKHPNAPKAAYGIPKLCPSDCGYIKEPFSFMTCEHFKDDCSKCWGRSLEE